MRASLLLVVLVGLCYLHSAVSHLCIRKPLQRGGFSIDSPGEHFCYRKVGPCGDVAPGPVREQLQGGQTYTIEFQQNLNHFNHPVPTSPLPPGYLDASIAFTANPTEADFEPFGEPIPDWNAMNQITQTNFSLNGVVPNVNASNAVLRVRYVSNNKGEDDRGEIFYQCSDVAIAASTNLPGYTPKPHASTRHAQSPSPVAPHHHQHHAPQPKKPQQRNSGTPCCTPKQWEGRFTGTGWRGFNRGQISYDATQQFMRVDVVVGTGQGITQKDGTFHIYFNFTNGYQWMHNVNNNTCGLYGLDMWFEWCYGGDDNAHTYDSSVTIGDTACDVWSTGNFRFANSQNTCKPVSLWRTEQAGDFTLYENITEGIADPTVFTPPAVCSSSHLSLVAPSPPPSPHEDVNHPHHLVAALARHLPRSAAAVRR